MDRSFVFQWASCTVLAKQSAWAAPIRMSSCISIGGTNFASICTPAKRIERRNHKRSLAKLPDVCKLSQQLAALLDEVVVIAGRQARLMSSLVEAGKLGFSLAGCSMSDDSQEPRTGEVP